MPGKRKRSCPFPSSKRRRKKSKKSFNQECAAILAASDRGSYYNQQELLEEVEERVNNREMSEETVDQMSASRGKIQLNESVENPEETDAEETWMKMNGRAIVSGERLQKHLSEAVSCRFCQGDVEIMENVSARNGLGSSWIFQCQNKSCPSQSANSAFTTTEKRKCFEVNRATVLGLRATGCGHAAASKFLSFLGLAPISKSCWAAQTKTIERGARALLEEELNLAARGVKEWKFSLGEVHCSLEELDGAVVDAGVTIDASWCSRGWTATDAVIAAISVDTGKVVDVVHMSSSCGECKKMEKKGVTGMSAGWSTLPGSMSTSQTAL